MIKYKWPLAVDPFTIWDRLKVCCFLLNKNNMLTMGPKVAEFERKMSEFSGSHALAVSSGSAANFVVFELWKQKNPKQFNNALVICPAVTWVSSITPAIHCGYKIQFCDINLNDFCFDYDKLEEILDDNRDKNLIIWPTALIGNVPDFERLRKLAQKYNAELFCDCAENMLSNYNCKNILAATSLSTTSCYWSHEIVAVEFGFVFFKDYDDYIRGKLLRNHGLLRSLEPTHILRENVERENLTIDKEFLFVTKGTNLRPTDIHAVFGLCDFNRVEKYKKHRKDIYRYYYDHLDRDKYYLPIMKEDGKAEFIGFCLPIFTNKNNLDIIKKLLNNCGIQTRPIIGSNLLIQPAFQEYFAEAERYGIQNTEWLHTHGCYTGLNNFLKEKDIIKLLKILNLSQLNVL